MNNVISSLSLVKLLSLLLLHIILHLTCIQNFYSYVYSTNIILCHTGLKIIKFLFCGHQVNCNHYTSHLSKKPLLKTWLQVNDAKAVFDILLVFFFFHSNILQITLVRNVSNLVETLGALLYKVAMHAISQLLLLELDIK